MSTIVADILRDAYLLRPLQLAYHEVGHVLVAHRCGRRLTRVSVNAHGGLTTSEGVASPLILLLVSLGGDRAERLAPESIENLADLDVGSKDKSDINFALDVLGGDQLHRDFVLQDAIAQVDELLEQERDRLDRIARRLLQYGRLEGYELRPLLEAGAPDPGTA